MSDRDVRKLAKIVADHSRQIKGLSGGPQAAYSSIEGGSMDSYDSDGKLRLRIGAQDDGTHAIKYVQGPPPPRPTAPVVSVDGPVVRVRWDGEFADGAVMPEDFARVDVHVEGPSTARVAGTLTTRAGSEVVLKATEQGEHTVTLIAVSASETPSDPSEPCVVEVAFASFTGAIESVVGSSNGINRITYSPRPPGPEDEGKPGDTWWVNEEREHADTGELYIAITEQWQYTPGGWTQVALAHEVIASVDLGTATVGFLHGQRIVAGSIDTELLAATAIDGMIITGAIFQTSHENPKGIFDADGLRFVDEDGAPTVHLSPHSETNAGDFFGMRGADGESIFNVSEEGVTSTRGLSIETDPIFAGDELLGAFQEYEHPYSGEEPLSFIERMPWGIVARGYQNVQGRGSVADGWVELGEISHDAYPGRMYKISVEPIGVYASPGAYVQLRMHQTINGSTPTVDSTPTRIFPARSAGGTSGNRQMHQLGGLIYHYYDNVQGGDVLRPRILFSIQAYDNNGTGVAGVYNTSWGGSLRVVVEDIGPFLEDTVANRTGRSAAPPPPPPPAIRNYTKTWTATGGRTFWTSGGYRTDNTQYAYQGSGPVGSSQRSIMIFPSMTGDLAGSEITGMRAYLYFPHWWYSSGGSARIHVHGASSLPGSLPSMTLARTEHKWPKPGGRWVNIPKAYWNGFRTGTYRGIGLGVASGTRTEYGYATISRTKLEIKYRK